MAGRSSRKQQIQRMSELRDAFQMFDKDKDGEISTADLGKVMNFLEFHPTNKELKMMIEKADIDRNGSINFNEFLVMMTNNKTTKNTQQIDEEEIRQMFETFDKSHKGVISPKDIKEVMTELGENLTEEEMDSMIFEVDPKRSGKIDFKKFKVLVENLMYS